MAEENTTTATGIPFKGIKKVTRTTFEAIKDASGKTGYIWFVRDIETSGDAKTVKSADIYLGADHYAHLTSTDIDKVAERLGKLEGTVSGHTTSIEKIETFLGDVLESQQKLKTLLDGKVGSVNGKDAIVVSGGTATAPIVELKISNEANTKVILSQSESGLSASAVTASAITSGDTGLATADKVYGAIQSAIADLDGAVSGTGAFVTGVTQTDGKVTATKGDLTSADKTVTISGLDLVVNVDGETIVKDSSTGKLSVKSTAIAVTGKDAIKVTDNNGKQVELLIKAGNKVLTQDTNGLDTTLGLKFVKASENTAEGANKGKAVIQLTGVGNAVLGEFDATDLVMDGVLDTVELKGSELTFTWNTDSDKEATTIDLAKYIKPYKAGEGLDLSGDTFSVKIKANDKYLTVGEDGVASKGIDDAIAAEIGKLDSTGGTTEVASDKHVAVQVVQENGKIKEVNVAESDIASASDLTETDSRVTALEEKVGKESVSSAITAALDELALAEVGGTGKYIKAVKQENGKVTATAEDLTAANVTATAVSDGGATTVQGILGELNTKIENAKSAAISVKAGKGITVTGEGTEKTIAAKAKDGDKYIEVTEDGIASKGIEEAIESAVSDIELSATGDSLISASASGLGITVSATTGLTSAVALANSALQEVEGVKDGFIEVTNKKTIALKTDELIDKLMGTFISGDDFDVIDAGTF